ncbi:MAG: hypothetical protein GY845_23895 [Planctomycetes bacterium]|nr:hypothetical protein [Planctomycetota bacterium]
MSPENLGVFQLLEEETQMVIAREDWNIACLVQGLVRFGLWWSCSRISITVNSGQYKFNIKVFC